MQEKEEPFALGLIDIDDFKAINDNLGHSVGDMVMVELVQNIEKSLDNGDIVARFGDEEFCVVLKNKDHKKALEWFLKLKSKINSLSLRTKEGKNVGFSLSIGVAFSDGGDTNEMLKQADFALRKAKQNGKNRVEIA